MSLINDLKNASQLTEREKDIRSYFLSHPEYIVNISERLPLPVPHLSPVFAKNLAAKATRILNCAF